MFKNFPVIVDTVQKSKLTNIVVNSNDLKTFKLTITINQFNKPIDLTGATVRIAIVKPDNKTVFQDCTIIDSTTGICEVVLDTQAFIIAGVYIAEVMIYFGADTVAVTGRFSYSVSKGILDNSTVESTNDWQAITQAIDAAEGILIDLRENGTGIDVHARSELETVTTQLVDTVNDLKSGGINVLSSGATGDGSVIDSNAISSALTFTTISPVQRVKIPDGTYLVNKTIVIPRGVHLELGQKAIIKPTSGDFNIFQLKPEARLTGGVVDLQNVNFTKAVYYLDAVDVFQFYGQSAMISDMNILNKVPTTAGAFTGTGIK